MKSEQLTLFDLPPQIAQAKPAKANAPKKQPPTTARVTVVKSISDALKCTAGGLCLICPDWPDFDPNDRQYFTQDSEKYIEAERLPPDWLVLVGKTVCADRTTVGTIADLLEELPPDVAAQWRDLYADSESDEGERALWDFERAHHIRWYGEGYYIADNDEESEAVA